MALEVLEVDMTFKQLQDAVKPQTDTEVVFLTKDNKAIKIQNARLILYNTISANQLRKIASK